MHKNLKEDFISNLGEETHNTNHKITNKLQGKQCLNMGCWRETEDL